MKNEKELATISALLLTDGGVSKISKNQWEIFVTSKSNEILKLFEKNIVKIFHKKTTRIINKNGVIKSRVCDKKIGEILLKLSPSFRTRSCSKFPICPLMKGKQNKPCKKCESQNGFPPVIIPDFILLGKDKEIRNLVIRVAMSTDGCIEFHENKLKNKQWFQRRLSFRCHNPNLLDQWSQLFRGLGFKIKKTEKEIRITGKDQLIKFRNEIGFLKNVEVQRSKNWKGFTKNNVLDRAIESFNMR